MITRMNRKRYRLNRVSDHIEELVRGQVVKTIHEVTSHTFNQ